MKETLEYNKIEKKEWTNIYPMKNIPAKEMKSIVNISLNKPPNTAENGEATKLTVIEIVDNMLEGKLDINITNRMIA